MNQENKLRLKNVTVAYPVLYTPRENTLSGKKEYSVQVRIYKSDEGAEEKVKAIREAMQNLAKAKWGDKAAKNYKAALDSKNTRWLQYNDEEGFFYFSAKRKEADGAPSVVGRAREKLREDDGKPRSGDKCNIVILPWIYDNANSRGFSCTLLGVQWVEEGEPIGSTAVATEDDFEELAPAADNDDGFGDEPI